MDMKVFVIFLLNILLKTKTILFYQHEHKKINIFSHIKSNFQPRT